MVQAPGFFTFAAQLVRTLWSRSVAVIVSLSSAASKRKFDRIGMVVLRSTTDCAAVSSRRISARETEISRLPVATASGVVVAAGMILVSPWCDAHDGLRRTAWNAAQAMWAVFV